MNANDQSTFIKLNLFQYTNVTNESRSFKDNAFLLLGLEEEKSVVRACRKFMATQAIYSISNRSESCMYSDGTKSVCA